ncbi:MAG: hypothetical protein IPF81_06660 [Bacteroidetes bacterium]|nr:hypothetical protein [Bacteroidota bacterium]
MLRTYFFTLTFFFCSACFVSGQNITKENLIKDLDDYSKKIIKNHAHPFNYIRKDQFLDSVKVLKAKAPSMNLDELKVAFIRLNALLLDPHTSFAYPKDKIFPLSFIILDDGIFLSASSIKYISHLGSRVIAMNAIPVDSILSGIKFLVGATNQSWIKYYCAFYLSSPGILYGLHFIPTKDSVVLTLLNNQDTSMLTVKSENEFSLEMQSFQPLKPMLRSGSRQNYWYQYIEEKKSLYIQYRTCFEMELSPFAKFQENVLQELHTSKPERIIIDVRSNSGGLVNVFLPLIKALARDSICKSAKVAVLISRKTFSAAIWNTFEMKNQLNATLIGEETGGDLNHPGAVVNFELKHTGMKVYYSKYDFYLDATVKGGILPDIYTEHKWEDYKNGIDVELEKAFSY